MTFSLSLSFQLGELLLNPDFLKYLAVDRTELLTQFEEEYKRIDHYWVPR